MLQTADTMPEALPELLERYLTLLTSLGVRGYGLDVLRHDYAVSGFRLLATAMGAAMAAGCAHAQGRFWAFHDLLFKNQQKLADEDLLGYAKELGLDVAKWKADWAAEPTADAVARARKLGDALGVTGTPAMFINGREYDIAKFDLGEDLQDWIRLEIELAGGTAAAPRASAAAASGTTLRARRAATTSAQASNADRAGAAIAP